MKLKGTIEKIVDFAVQVAEPEEIYLFGSMADGTDNEYSDIDFLIVSNNGIDRKEIISRIQNHAREHALKIDVLIRSPKELANELETPNSFIKAIKKKGVVMYKK